MAKHFISVLGVGLYSNCVYKYKGKGEKEYQYVQEAILNLCIKDFGKDDKISIFCTDEAKKRNWFDYKMTDEDYEEIKYKHLMEEEELIELKNAGGEKEGLYSKLKNLNFQVKKDPIKILEGRTEKELWEIFNTVLDVIKDDDELYVDITHGLRSIPMQLLVILQFAKVKKKNISIKGIFYGAYEVGEKKDIGLEEIYEAPIFDLTIYDSILNWSSATEAFVKNGDGNLLKSIFDTNLNENNELENKELIESVKGIVALTNTLETSRGKNLETNDDDNFKRSIYKAYKKFETNYKKLSNKKISSELQPLKELMEVIDNDTSIFNIDSIDNLVEKSKDKKDLKEVFKNQYKNNINLAIGLASIKWAIDKKLPQQGFTALEETVKTLLCVTYGLNETLEISRQAIAANLLSKISEIDKNNETIKEKVVNICFSGKKVIMVRLGKDKANKIYEYFIENNKNLCKDNEFNKVEKYLVYNINKKFKINLTFKEIGEYIKKIKEIIETLNPNYGELSKGNRNSNNSNNISDVRNSINHFSYSFLHKQKTFSYEEINEKLEDFYNKLIRFVIDGIKK